jgi:hypothetical protein
VNSSSIAIRYFSLVDENDRQRRSDAITRFSGLLSSGQTRPGFIDQIPF